jgi:hypothetical protein
MRFFFVFEEEDGDPPRDGLHQASMVQMAQVKLDCDAVLACSGFFISILQVRSRRSGLKAEDSQDVKSSSEMRRERGQSQ